MGLNVALHNPVAMVANHVNHGCSNLAIITEDGQEILIFMPGRVCEAVVDAFNGRYEELIGFLEEVRDFKPTVLSGKDTSDPQRDMDDMMPLGEFLVLQDDAKAMLKGGA